MTQYQPCERADARTVSDYLASLSSPIDSYLEDHILASKMFRIVDADAEIGCFAIHEGGLLTLFHVRREQQRLGQPLLADIRQKHEIASALVPTCDEFFLSHVLDAYRELNLQAYFFADSGTDPASPTGAADVQYRLAQPSDIETITAVGGDFLEDAADRISRNEVTVGLLGREIVSIGLIIPNRLLRAPCQHRDVHRGGASPPGHRDAHDPPSQTALPRARDHACGRLRLRQPGQQGDARGGWHGHAYAVAADRILRGCVTGSVSGACRVV